MYCQTSIKNIWDFKSLREVIVLCSVIGSAIKYYITDSLSSLIKIKKNKKNSLYSISYWYTFNWSSSQWLSPFNWWINTVMILLYYSFGGYKTFIFKDIDYKFLNMSTSYNLIIEMTALVDCLVHKYKNIYSQFQCI